MDEFVPCAVCNGSAVDIHHIVFKSRGGGNDIENLIALCRTCHNKAHQSQKGAYSQKNLLEITQKNINEQAFKSFA